MDKVAQEMKKQNEAAAIRARQNAEAEGAALLEVNGKVYEARQAAIAADLLAVKWEEAQKAAASRYLSAVDAKRAWEAVANEPV